MATKKRAAAQGTRRRLSLSRASNVSGNQMMLGKMPALTAAARLEAMGDKGSARQLRSAVRSMNKNPQFAKVAAKWFEPKAYQWTEHAHGYVPNDAKDSGEGISIVSALTIEADATLKASPIKITLDTLRTFQYPGGGEHQVLFNFEGQHQTTDADQQSVKFAQTYRARDTTGAGVSGYPIFTGLRPPAEGVMFSIKTTNVRSSSDQKILTFLGSGVFKEGLKLASAANPVVPIVAGFATGIADAFARRNDDAVVQEFLLGLDFSSSKSRAKLREGVYISVQVPDAAAWNWADFRFRESQVVLKGSPTKRPPVNYVIFSVSKVAAK